jgi:hypothetical protein
MKKNPSRRTPTKLGPSNVHSDHPLRISASLVTLARILDVYRNPAVPPDQVFFSCRRFFGPAGSVLVGGVLGKFEEVIRPESLKEFLSRTPDHRSIQFEREDYEMVARDPSRWTTLFTKPSKLVWKGEER